MQCEYYLYPKIKLTMNPYGLLQQDPLCITIHCISQYMNSLMLSSKLSPLETTMRGKMMVITSYFKDELQLIYAQQSVTPLKKTEIRS